MLNKQIMLNSLSFWERCRIPYNLVLALIVICFWGVDMALSGPNQWLGAVIVLLLFGGIANVLFCIVYPLDIVAQLLLTDSMRSFFRWGTFVSGLAVAIILELIVILSPGMA